MEKKEWLIIFVSLVVCIAIGAVFSSTYSSITGAMASDSISLPPIPSTPGAPPPSCNDGIQNQDETDVDCGGICLVQGKKCGRDKGCILNEDCESSYCYIHRCKIKPVQLVTPLMEKEPEPKPEEKIILSIGPPSTIPRTPNTYTISIERKNGRFAFVPNIVETIAGDVITWTNNDNVQHQPVTLDRVIEGNKLVPNQQWSLTLTTPGKFVFNDDYNPSTQGLWNDFKATVIVQPWSGTCDDGIKNLDETDIDCGGHCPQCKVGKSCKVNKDCTTSLCRNNLCSNPLPISCTDSIKNQVEADIDCGGPCPKCPDGKACRTSDDCQSGSCANGICLTPSCTDGIKNQDETDIDCGGRCKKCVQGNTCLKNIDCVTNACINGICDIPTTEIQMIAKQFEFVPSTITVAKGNRVIINVTSIDVPHGFSLPSFNVQERLEPNVPRLIKFIADKTGEFEFICHVYCGSGHSKMRGKLIVSEKKAEAVGKIPQEAAPTPVEEKPTPSSKRSLWWILPVLLLLMGVGFYLYKLQQAPEHEHVSKEIDFVKEYVAATRKKGYNDEHIYHQLIKHGYPKQEVEKYIQLPGEKLEHYVKRLRRLGYTKDKIMKELLAAGHKPVEIHDALERAKW